MYLVWINPPINFTFSDDSVFLKKILVGDINSLNLLVISLNLIAYIQNLVTNGPVVSEKSQVINFDMQLTLGQGQEMTVTLNTHINSFTQLVNCIYQHSGHRLQ